MGYMGLQHWNDSDTAFDFFCDLEESKNPIELIEKQIDKDNGPYNTSGAINVALLIEDGKILRMPPKLSDKLTAALFKQLRKVEEKAWRGDLDNWSYHVDAYKRLLDVVVVNSCSND